jgi:hypothetical protein
MSIIREIIEIAFEIIQRANEIKDSGQIQTALLLYNNVRMFAHFIFFIFCFLLFLSDLFSLILGTETIGTLRIL